MELYKRLEPYILTEDQLKENNFPQPDPTTGGKAVFYGDDFNKQKARIKGIEKFMIILISSPELSGSQGELIVYPYSGVRCRRRQQYLNIFSSETALPIKAKFYVEPPWEGGTKVYINGPGHMTKMAAMPIYGKNLLKSSSPEPEVLWSWNLACSIGDSSSTKFI